ncbi:MAG: hypothetical protein GY928_34250 [Colwellia sp.]|nr:hypothetical protein [Colwellia sp.]
MKRYKYLEVRKQAHTSNMTYHGYVSKELPRDILVHFPGGSTFIEFFNLLGDYGYRRIQEKRLFVNDGDLYATEWLFELEIEE